MCRPAQECRGCGPFGTRVGKLTTFMNVKTYHYAIVARQFVKAGRVRLALVVRMTLLVGMVEDVEVVPTNVVAGNDIGNEFEG